MKSILVGLILLAGIAKCHYFCPSNNLVVLELNSNPATKCDIPRAYLTALLEMDVDSKIDLVGSESFVVTFKQSFPEKAVSDGNDPACNEKQIPDCKATWIHKSNGKFDIKLEVGKEM